MKFHNDSESGRRQDSSRYDRTDSPQLFEDEISPIVFFSLLSISTRTHLINQAKIQHVSSLMRFDLGVALLLKGNSLLVHGINVESSDPIVADPGDYFGISSRLPFRGTIEVIPVNKDGIETVSTVAYWSDDVIRSLLPHSIRNEFDEKKLLDHMRKHKQLLRHPVFQSLSESALSDVVASSAFVMLEEEPEGRYNLNSDDAISVISGACEIDDNRANVLGPGQFWNLTGLVGGQDTVTDYLITSVTFKCEILMIPGPAFRSTFFKETSSESALIRINQVKEYLADQDGHLQLKDVRIGKTLGRGGTSIVKQAFVGNDQYAIKIIKKRLLLKSNKVNLLKNEKQILQALSRKNFGGHSNPFIVQLKETFKDFENIYFLLEYAPGGDMLSVINKLGILSKNQAQFYCACLLEGLIFCHSHGVIYRDLKPENCLVDSMGYVKLSDFGIAKKFPNKFVTHTTYSLVGTPEFMAPEIILGKGYSYAIDMWALGCCMYEFTVGKLPFDSNTRISCDSALVDQLLEPPNVTSLFQSILQFDPETDLNFPNSVDGSSKSFMTGLLNPDPDLRICGESGRNHLFFSDFYWIDFASRKMHAPYVPSEDSPRPFLDDGGVSSVASGVVEASPTLSFASFDGNEFFNDRDDCSPATPPHVAFYDRKLTNDSVAEILSSRRSSLKG